jgi:hypothetical protein
MWRIEAMHEAARHATDAAEMLEQANEGAILRIAGCTAEGIGNGLLSAKDLLPGHRYNAERRENEDAQPNPPDAKEALLRYRHDETGLGGEAAPGRQDAECALDADHNDNVVIAIHVHRVQAALVTTVMRLQLTARSKPCLC